MRAALAVAAVLAMLAWAAVANAAVITSGPPAATTSTTATFTFTVDARAPVVACILDGAQTRTCSSPMTLTGLTLGAHAFAVEERDTGGTVLSRAVHQWTITPPGPPPVIPVVTVPPVAPPGGLVQIDASASIGPITSFSFDTDGNGSYETKCGATAKAGSVYTKPGTYTVGVLVESAGGKAVASANVTIPPGAATPPVANVGMLTQGVVAATCLDTDVLAGAIKAYTCPRSVAVGVAEAAFPAGTPKEACFERKTVNDGAGPRQVFIAPDSQIVALNGLQVWPLGASLALDATSMRVNLRKGTALAPTQPAQVFVKDLVGHVDIHTTLYKLDWNVAKPTTVAELPLGSLATSGPSGGDFLGLPIPSTLKVPVMFPFAGASRLPIRVKLPEPFAALSSAEIVLELDNTDGPKVADAKISFGKIPFGAVTIEGLNLSWHAEGASDVWEGSLGMVLPPGAKVAGTMRIRDGSLQQLTVTAQPPPPGIPMTCCLYLVELHGGMTASYISAGGTIGTIAQVLGKQLLSFKGTVFVFYANGFSVAVKGDLKAIDGKFQLAKGSIVATANDLSFNGSVDQKFAILSAKAFVGGAVAESGKWHAAGYGNLCVDVGKNWCAGGGVAASNIGIAGCVKVDIEIDTVEVGGLVRWDGSWKVFWECSFQVLKQKVGASREGPGTQESGSGARAFTLARGRPKMLVRVRGVGGAPFVVVRGPGGRRVVVRDIPADSGRGWLYVRDAATGNADIVIARAAAGRWTVTPLPGSAAIASVATADPLPPRQVSASVTGRGLRRVLRYRVALAPGRRVVFVERGPGVERTVGRARGATGTIPFTIADGPAGRRTIEAVIEANGSPVKATRVAAFRAPAPFVPAAPRVQVARAGRSMVVRWRPVPDATRYRVRVVLSDGRSEEFVRSAAARFLRVRGVSARMSGTVRVRGVARSGRLGRVRLARLFAERSATAPSSVRLGALRRSGVLVRCVPAADGTCTVVARIGRRVVARGGAGARYAVPRMVRVRLTASGRAVVRAGSSLRLTIAVPGERDSTAAVRVAR